MRRTKEDAEATRQSILDAALMVFGRQGFTATSLEEIARTAGVTRGAVYWHFKNKLALYKCLIDQSYDRVAQAEASILAANVSPLEKLRTIMNEYLRHLAENQWFRAIEKVSVFNMGTTEELAPLTATANDYIRQKKDGISTLVAQGISQGEIRSNLSPDLIAAAVVSYLYGIEMSWLSDEGLFPLKKYLAQMVDLFLDGIRQERWGKESHDE